MVKFILLRSERARHPTVGGVKIENERPAGM